ncbi:MAG: hypothetical protein ABR521_09110 [Gaiellaceae bacterium]
MGAWYWIGLAVGVGAGVGVLVSGPIAPARAALPAALALAGAAGAGAGYAIDGWWAAAGGAAGGLAGATGALQLARGTLRRGGTRAGTAVLFALGGLLLGALALVPVLGYVEAALLPAVAARLRRRAGDRYAGLRVLARD